MKRPRRRQSPAAVALRQDPDAVATTPDTAAPCGARYELVAGDYWIRIADASGVSLAELLEVNGASVDTTLVPGRSICLPVGAGTPAPPTTVATPAAPPAPATTSAPRRSVTTAAPAPTTTVASRPAAVPQSQAAAIIRDVWPDHLEERALEIAWRESNHRSNVNNFCCYGLFQIHWEAHRSWLATIGITSVSQLFDPVANANAAYVLYQRSGGFGPWGG
jgi:LysM repeat protein